MKILIYTFLITLSIIFAMDVGTVASTTGQVYSQQLGQKMTPLKKNSIIKEGVYIITRANSKLKITLIDGSGSMTVGPNSRLKIQKQTIKRKSSSTTSISLFSGTMGASLKKLANKNNGFNVHTPTAVAGIRGTDFTVAAGLDGSSYVEVTDGKVAVDNGKGEVICNKDESAENTIGSEEVPQKQELSDEDQLNNWLSENEEVVNDNPDKALKRMEKHLEQVKEKAETLALQSEQTADKELPTDNNVIQYRQQKALEMNQSLIGSDTANEGILENANLLLEKYKDNRKVKKYNKNNGIARINKMISDYNSRIDAALNRLNTKLEEAYKRLDDNYKETSERIDDSFDKKNFDIKDN